MQAVKMFEQGMRPFQVAEVLRVSLKSACAWHRTWRAGGAQALESKGPAGQKCRLNSGQLRRLEAELEAGSAAQGWVDQRWTLDRVAALISRLFGMDYTQRGTSLLLHRLGWSPQISAHRPIERDEEAVDTWLRETWPRIKGQRRSRTDGSVSRTKQDGSSRPSRARTWSRRGVTPVANVSGRGSGRVSIAGLVCFQPGRRGSPVRFLYRTREHRGRKGERRSFGERDYIALLDATHRQLGGPIVLVWDNLNTNLSRAMRRYLAVRRDWLTPSTGSHPMHPT